MLVMLVNYLQLEVNILAKKVNFLKLKVCFLKLILSCNKFCNRTLQRRSHDHVMPWSTLKPLIHTILVEFFASDLPVYVESQTKYCYLDHKSSGEFWCVSVNQIKTILIWAQVVSSNILIDI